MGPFIKLAAIGAAVFCVLASGAVFALGAIAAEDALRPARIPVALVCPCLAHTHCKSVAVTAREGVTLRGWYYTPETSNGKAIMLLHGLGSNREDMVAPGDFFLRRGYSVLEPDLRGHGESGGLMTYGLLEAGDTHIWLDWLDGTEHPSRIYGYGAALGASVLLESLRPESPGDESPVHFSSVAVESPYFDLPSFAKERVVRALPSGVRRAAGPFVDSGIIWMRWHDGIDLRKASPADGVRFSLTRSF